MRIEDGQGNHGRSPLRTMWTGPTLERPLTCLEPLTMLYELHYVGGPENGRMTFAFRPYFRMKHPDHAVYQAEMEGNQPVMEWVDDDTRAITLHFEGYWPAASFAEE